MTIVYIFQPILIYFSLKPVYLFWNNQKGPAESSIYMEGVNLKANAQFANW